MNNINIPDKIVIKNFRAFSKIESPIKSTTIIVGINNAGKSTLIEALRLVSLITSRYKNLNYNNRPTWLDIPKKIKGVFPSLKHIEINFSNIFHRYGEPPSEIEVTFSNGNKVKAYLGGNNDLFGIIEDCNGKIISNKTDAARIDIPIINILPQIGPLSRKETILTEDYIKSSLSSPLASLHFRNQLKYFTEYYNKFKSMVEQTWPNIRIEDFFGKNGMAGEDLLLEIRNGDYVGEISTMGHGLQMWLQTIWFLARNSENSTIILDEPDVYMHADLQRRLIRYIKDRYKQVIIATHSVEIMAEVIPDNILIINKQREAAKFATSLPIVQKLVEQIGSTHNLHLARLWHSRVYLQVEGDDIAYLKRLQDKLFPSTDTPLDIIPSHSVEGWGGWQNAIGSSTAFKNALGEDILTYCIFDCDFHTDEEISDRLNQAQQKGIQLKIWNYKEIENYFIVTDAIYRILNKEKGNRTTLCSLEELDTKIETFAKDMYEECLDSFSQEILAKNRSLGSSGANKRARAIIKSKVEKLGSIKCVVSGKDLISKLSNWTQSEFSINLSPIKLCCELREDEIHQEIVDLITSIENRRVIINN